MKRRGRLPGKDGVYSFLKSIGQSAGFVKEFECLHPMIARIDRCILSVAVHWPIIRRLRAKVVDLTITVSMLAIIRVTSIIRYASAAIVDDVVMMMSYCPLVDVRSIFHDEAAVVDGYRITLLEEVGFHGSCVTTSGRKSASGRSQPTIDKGQIYPTWGQCGKVKQMSVPGPCGVFTANEVCICA